MKADVNTTCNRNMAPHKEIRKQKNGKKRGKIQGRLLEERKKEGGRGKEKCTEGSKNEGKQERKTAEVH